MRHGECKKQERTKTGESYALAVASPVCFLGRSRVRFMIEIDMRRTD